MCIYIRILRHASLHLWIPTAESHLQLPGSPTGTRREGSRGSRSDSALQQRSPHGNFTNSKMDFIATTVPSDKHTKNERKIHHDHLVNPLFESPFSIAMLGTTRV